MWFVVGGKIYTGAVWVGLYTDFFFYTENGYRSVGFKIWKEFFLLENLFGNIYIQSAVCILILYFVNIQND